MRRNYIKDAYKKINYEAPFNETDKQRLLTAIKSAQNPEELNALGVPKVIATNLTKHFLEDKPLEVIEHLLDVRKMDVVKMERLCKTVLKTLNKQSEDFEAENSDDKYWKLRKHLHPKCVPSLANIQNIYGLKFSVFSVAFCHLNVVKLTYRKL